MLETESEFLPPPGNWLAAEIKRLNDNSKGVFPTPQPGDERTRYKTIYSINYDTFPEGAYKAQTPALLKRPLKKDAPFLLDKSKRFNSWQVRSDLVEADKVHARVAERRRTALDSRVDVNLPSIAMPLAQPIPKASTAEPRRSQSIQTPVLPPGQPIKYTSQSSRTSALRKIRDEATRLSAPAIIRGDRSSGRKDIKPELLEAAEQYLKTAPHADRRVIDKALRISDRHIRMSSPSASSEPCDPKKEVGTWLENANEQERNLALSFFQVAHWYEVDGSSIQ